MTTEEKAASSTNPDEVTFKELVQMLDNAVALVDAETWEVLFENAQFFRWFPAAVEEVEILTERVPEFNVERAKSRLEADRPYSFETKSRNQEREEPIRVSLRPFTGIDRQC